MAKKSEIQSVGDDTRKPDEGASGATLPTDSFGISNESANPLDVVAKTHIDALAGFDPEIHAVNPDGSPKRKPDGNFALKRGRKPGGARAPISKEAQQAVIVNPARAAAVESAMFFAYGSAGLFGDEWKPQEGELENLERAFERYYVAKGITEFPPGIGLALALSAYTLPRLTQPETKTKLQKLGLWVKEKSGKAMKFVKGD